MFVIVAIPIGVVVGLLLGGRIERLSQLQFAWAWLAVAGLAIQVVLFSTTIADTFPPGVGEAIYVASTGMVLIAVWRNLAVPGLAVVAIGAISNLAAVVANVGVMPTTAEALRTAGMATEEGFSNSAVLRDPALAPLTDIFAIPAAIPLANVFSIGDVLIAVGLIATIALGMRRRGAETRSV